jgi:hypothetical protein
VLSHPAVVQAYLGNYKSAGIAESASADLGPPRLPNGRSAHGASVPGPADGAPPNELT